MNISFDLYIVCLVMSRYLMTSPLSFKTSITQRIIVHILHLSFPWLNVGCSALMHGVKSSVLVG